jgi:hypothetical protein
MFFLLIFLFFIFYFSFINWINVHHVVQKDVNKNIFKIQILIRKVKINLFNTPIVFLYLFLPFVHFLLALILIIKNWINTEDIGLKWLFQTILFRLISQKNGKFKQHWFFAHMKSWEYTWGAYVSDAFVV